MLYDRADAAGNVAFQALCPNLVHEMPAVCLQGHSLGGSLATVLMLMYTRRGVIPVQAVSPIYTFGAPAVFCEASACSCSPAALPLPSSGSVNPDTSGMLSFTGSATPAHLPHLILSFHAILMAARTRARARTHTYTHTHARPPYLILTRSSLLC